jgi:hypothetical protein
MALLSALPCLTVIGKAERRRLPAGQRGRPGGAVSGFRSDLSKTANGFTLISS